MQQYATIVALVASSGGLAARRGADGETFTHSCFPGYCIAHPNLSSNIISLLMSLIGSCIFYSEMGLRHGLCASSKWQN